MYPQFYRDPVSDKRTRCSAKERARNHAMNASFHQLQALIPHLPATRRVPRIKLLRLASTYIDHLRTILQEGQVPEGPGGESLERTIRREVVRQNSYKTRAENEMAGQVSAPPPVANGHAPAVSSRQVAGPLFITPPPEELPPTPPATQVVPLLQMTATPCHVPGYAPPQHSMQMPLWMLYPQQWPEVAAPLPLNFLDC